MGAYHQLLLVLAFPITLVAGSTTMITPPFISGTPCLEKAGNRVKDWCISHDSTDFRLVLTESSRLLLVATKKPSARAITLWDQSNDSAYAYTLATDPALYLIPHFQYLMLIATFTDTAVTMGRPRRRELRVFVSYTKPVLPPFTVSSWRRPVDSENQGSGEPGHPCVDTIGKILIEYLPRDSDSPSKNIWAVWKVMQCGNSDKAASEVHVQPLRGGYMPQSFSTSLSSIITVGIRSGSFFYIH